MPLASLTRLGDVWQRRTRRPTRWLAGSVAAAACFGVAHLARVGTGGYRLAAVALLVLGALAWVLWLRHEWRTRLSPRLLIRRVVAAYDVDLARRAERALGLVEQSERTSFAGSPTLARLHLERLAQRASVARVEEAATRRARWLSLGAALVGLAALLVLLIGPMKLVEGWNVLAARGGRAPLPIPWLERVEVRAQPPSYLGLTERWLFEGATSEQPVGTLMTITGVPRVVGRHLVLTDGTREVPFVDDGAGGVVARYTLEESATLQIAARFGDVLIVAPEPLSLSARPDEPPSVDLSFRGEDGELSPAPATLKLEDLNRLELTYEARDDNGLRQIDLVISGSGRSERRVLGRFDGETRSERGGHALPSSDALLRRMFLPVELTIEARDGDPISGPKWGRSAVITLIPPVVGRPEARRYQALSSVRDKVADLVAWRTETERLPAAERPGRAKQDQELLRQVRERSTEVLEASYGGLTIPEVLKAFILGQLRVLERRKASGASELLRTEDVLLALDVALRRFATVEARGVAPRLGAVAEELAEAARAGREGEGAPEVRLRAALDALTAGALELKQLGTLGADLGSVAEADLGRIRRAHAEQSYSRVEVAARHLAARLQRPNPSFGAASQSGSMTGDGGMPSGEPSQADAQFNQLLQELDSLARDHAEALGDVQRMLSDAEQGLDLSNLEEEAKRRAEAVRRGVSGLPLAGNPGSARATAALAREHAESMAQSLSKLSLADAVESGKRAQGAIKEALRKQDSSQEDRADLQRAQEALTRELAWAEQELARVKESAERRAGEALRRAGVKEQELARRTENLAERGKTGEIALPEDATGALERAEAAMRSAARSLSQGEGEAALKHQREAQRHLEDVTKGQRGDGDERGDGAEGDAQGQQGGDGKGMRTDGELPEQSKAARAEAFRRRVTEGLGKSKGGALSPAVKRYAESLLR
ncbi:MAG: DUF4175 domain-containing protein [Polyangiaceae bacterium]|nr:DUF4175 domain-containing protein [Polyangiaceae bacterium]MCW5789571.1 DUF4175 domain-containing protein [Polyangiaceae bacterium]